MNTNLQIATQLAPIAKQMRERQEQIERDKSDVYARIGNLVALASDQGRDCLLAKVKLGKAMRWSDWLHAHVPNLSEQDAAKYERISTEQISDPRQCVFAFLPERTQSEDKPERSKPSFFEAVLTHTYKLEALAKVQPVDQWPQDQQEAARVRLRPIVSALWPAIDG